jgi:LysR family glycine cleavage system transcriptional activator
MIPLPPLNALRAFEAAARHVSFSRAAEELCVTHGAISRQISKLESHLGTQLFIRRHRQVELTRKGVLYVHEVRAAFQRISQATTAMSGAVEKATLKVMVPPGFAIQWLIPRLSRFQVQHPAIAIQIITSHEPPQFGRENIDAAVHSGAEIEGADRLFGEILAPVCSPAFLKQCVRVPKPNDLLKMMLLRWAERPGEWKQWLNAANLPDLDPQSSRVLTLDTSSLIYQAAVDGLGVAIAKIGLVAEYLEKGVLVTPFALRIVNPHAYYFLVSPQRRRSRAVRDFHQWIACEAKLTREVMQETQSEGDQVRSETSRSGSADATGAARGR